MKKIDRVARIKRALMRLSVNEWTEIKNYLRDKTEAHYGRCLRRERREQKMDIRKLGPGARVVSSYPTLQGQILTVRRFGPKRATVVTEAGDVWRVPYSKLQSLEKAVLARAGADEDQKIR